MKRQAPLFAGFAALVGLTVGLIAGPTATGPAPARAEINLLQNDRLIEAAKTNDVSTAEGLLARNHNVDALDENERTPLILAASRGYEDFVDLLVRNRASLNAADKFGNTAMFYAASTDQTGVIHILAEGGADLNAKNRQGVTPLMVAASEGRLAAVQTLVELKADLHVTDFTGRTARDWAARNNRRVVLRIIDAALAKEANGSKS